MAEADKDLPKYMCLSGKTRFELAQSIDAAMEAAELMNESTQNQACFEICYDQIVDQLQEEYGLDLTKVLKPRDVFDRHTLKQDILATIGFCGAQYKLVKTHSTDLNDFKRTFENILKRSLQDALDIMISKGIWRFDLQRTLQEIEVRVKDATQQYQFT